MGEVTCWAVAQTINWSPIITFSRRRLELLEWFEREMEIFSFFEEPDAVGVEVSKHGDRLVVRRDRLTIELPDHGRVGTEVQRGVAGVLEILAPRGVAHQSTTGAWTALVDAPYEVARSAIVRGTTLKADEAGSWRFEDVAVLADLITDLGPMQIEFGVATADELCVRLQRPAISRLGGIPALRNLDRDELPSVSLLALLSLARRLPIADPESSLPQFLVDFQARAESIATDLAESLDSYVKEAP